MSMAVVSLMALIALKQFNASPWQSLIITAAPTVFFTLSIFWNDFFAHRRFASYLVTFWCVACFPLALTAFAKDYIWFAIPFVLTTIGGAGYYPAAGELLKRIYPATSRGRMYSIVQVLVNLGTAGIGFSLGKFLANDGESFRWFLPLAAGLQLIGVAIFIYLAKVTKADVDRVKIRDETPLTKRVLGPVLSMNAALRADPTFARYEAAYMTYGIGWMIAYALLPLIIKEKLKLNYDDAAKASQVAYLIGLVLMMVPAGYLLDRIGAVKSVALSFALLFLYPLGLMFAQTRDQLAVVSFFYGMVHAGTTVGWTLGPVSLAPTPDRVPQYVAIHATLVGVRGIVFQAAGVLLYEQTGSFTIPLVIAAAAFVLSAWQMWALDRRMKAALVTAVPGRAT